MVPWVRPKHVETIQPIHILCLFGLDLTSSRKQQHSVTQRLHTFDLNGHDSVPYSKADLTVVVHTGSLVDKRTTPWSPQSLELIEANAEFCIHEDASFDVKQSGEEHLPQQPNLSTSSSCSPVRTRFGFEPIQSCNNNLHFEGAERISNIPTILFKWTRKTYNLLGYSFSNQTTPAYSRSDRFLFKQTLMSLFPHDKVNKGRWMRTTQKSISFCDEFWAKHHRKREFGSVCSKTEWMKRIYLVHPSMRGSFKPLHDRLSRTPPWIKSDWNRGFTEHMPIF